MKDGASRGPRSVRMVGRDVTGAIERVTDRAVRYITMTRVRTSDAGVGLRAAARGACGTEVPRATWGAPWPYGRSICMHGHASTPTSRLAADHGPRVRAPAIAHVVLRSPSAVLVGRAAGAPVRRGLVRTRAGTALALEKRLSTSALCRSDAAAAHVLEMGAQATRSSVGIHRGGQPAHGGRPDGCYQRARRVGAHVAAGWAAAFALGSRENGGLCSSRVVGQFSPRVRGRRGHGRVRRLGIRAD